MNSRFTVVETNLNRAEFQWKWLRIVRHSSRLGILLCLVVLGLGWAIVAGYLTSKWAAIMFLSVLSAAALVTWFVLLVRILVGPLERRWLAAAVERVDRRFLDRLNTLLFLETRRGDARAEKFALQIARQAQRVAAEKTPPKPFHALGSYSWFLGFLVVVAVTALLDERFSPWDRLVVSQSTKPPPPVRDKPLELALPATNNVEQNRPWGEVRITEPGADLKVTKVDVVPLQIEAAANEALKTVGWFSTVNGAEETPHELPAPTEPRYAVYQPTVFLDELNLADWDVLTYYAKANTEPQNSYASDVYFLEVRPFREDILKLPGGESGKAYQTLSELSSLINRQQHVIRETHQHVQKPAEQENLQLQDRRKLAEAEADLSDSTKHLYAKMASEMENKSIGVALDNLAKAESSLTDASQSLKSNAVPDAQNHERSALSELVAARRLFQKAVSDHPEAFQEPNEEQSTPMADAAKSLSQMAEFRDEAKAANDFVKKMLDRQKELEQQSRSGLRNQYPRLGNQERELETALKDFEGQHPQMFKDSQQECQQAGQAMNQAADSLQRRRSEATSAVQQATRELENLSQSMQKQSAAQQLADAYKLKQMLDQQVQNLDRRSKPDSKMPDSELRKTTADARATLEQLKKASEQEPTRDAFGAPLREALGGQHKMELDAKLLQLDQAQDEASKQQRAEAAKEGLDKVSKAFEASQPTSLRMAHSNDSLQPAEKDSFSKGMAELESLLKQLERNRQISPEDRGKQGQQALLNLQTGMRSQYGDNEQGNQLLLQLSQMLAAEKGLEPGDLRKLQEALQRFSAEASEQLAKTEDQPEVTNIDPARLPPAYRGRIQTYFQKLSEK